MKINKIRSKVVSVARLSTIFALGIAQLFLLIGLSFPQSAAAYPLWIASVNSNNDSSTLQRGAEQADKAADQIYQGLDTTKRIIGKTDKRNQIIQEGREKASSKLDDLANKARSAQQTGESLPPNEQRVVDRLQ